MSGPKLVRDKIPDIIRAREGYEPDIRVAEPHERWRLLIDKLREEADEVAAAETYPGILNELADCAEVLAALMAEAANRCGRHISPTAVETARIVKYRERGGFDRGYVWTPPTQGDTP